MDVEWRDVFFYENIFFSRGENFVIKKMGIFLEEVNHECTKYVTLMRYLKNVRMNYTLLDFRVIKNQFKGGWGTCCAGKNKLIK